VLRYFESPGAIVFCNTRNAVKHLQAALLERGFSVVALSGELTQNERTNALQSLRDGRARVCVATDVAARGLDLPNLGLVIHAELPNDPEGMQHRSGRTGRAGRKGISVLLVPPSRRRRVEIMLSQAGIAAVWGPAPQPEEIRKLDQQRILLDPLLTEGVDRGRSDAGARVARRAVARRDRGGAGSGLSLAASFARRYSRSRPRRAVDRVTIAAKVERAAMRRPTIAAPDKNQEGKNPGFATAWRRAAYGFAPASDVKEC